MFKRNPKHALCGCRDVDVISQYIDAHPGDAEAYALRAFETALQAGLILTSGNPAEIERLFADACEDYTDAIRLEPNNGGYYYERGRAYMMRQMHAEAAADYSSALGLVAEPDQQIEILQLRATCNAFLQHRDLVVADFDTILDRIAEPERRLHFLLSRAGFHRDYEAKIADLTEALEIAPTNPDIWLARGWAHAEMGNFNAALQDAANGEALADAETQDSFQHLRHRIRDMKAG